MKRFDALFHLLLLPADFLGAFLGFFLAFWLRHRTDLIPFIQYPAEHLPTYEQAIPLFVAFALSLLVYMAVGKLYSLHKTGRVNEVPRVFGTVLFWWFSVIAYYTLVERTFFFSRLVLIHGVLFTILFIILLRLLLHGVRHLFYRRGVGRTRLLVLGQNRLASRLVSAFVRTPDYRIVGVLDDVRNTEWEVENPLVPWLGRLEDFPRIATLKGVDEVLVCRQPDQLTDLLRDAHERYIRFRFVPDLFEIHATNIETEEVEGFPIIELKPTRLDGWGKIWKRLFDVVAATIGLILASPFFLLVPIIIHVTSPGQAAIIGLTRVRKNRTFRLFKFRSMIPNAHGMKKDLAKFNERGDGPMFKMKNDPRVTPFGRFLRKSRIDELPQLLNVLTGEMSVVGPRPHEPEEVARYERHHRKLLAITPGITGLAQVHGASDLSFEEEVRLDTYYIENWSLFLDVEIILRTVWTVLVGRGAA